MQAIHTKFFGPANVQGAKIKAECAALSKFYRWDHSLSPEANHVAGARALIAKLGWDESNAYAGFATGSLRDRSYVHAIIRGVSEVWR